MVWDSLVQFGMSWDCFRWCGTVWDGLVLEQDSLGCGIPNKGQFNMVFAVQKILFKPYEFINVLGL